MAKRREQEDLRAVRGNFPDPRHSAGILEVCTQLGHHVNLLPNEIIVVSQRLDFDDRQR